MHVMIRYLPKDEISPTLATSHKGVIVPPAACHNVCADISEYVFGFCKSTSAPFNVT